MRNYRSGVFSYRERLVGSSEYDVCSGADGLYLVSESGGDITPNAVFPVNSGMLVGLRVREFASVRLGDAHIL